MSNVRVYFFLLLAASLWPYAAHGQWVRSTGPASGAVCFASVPDGAGGNTLFAGANGVFRSTDNGTSWVASGSGLPSVAVWALAVNGTQLFAGTWGYGVYSSNDNGASWSAVNNLALANSHVNALVASTGGSASSIIVATNDHGVYRTNNNGATWALADTGLIMLNWVCTSLAVSPDLPENVFASTDYGVFRSTDNGSHWTRIGLSVPIYTIAAKSTGGGAGVQIFAGVNNGHVYYYSGTSWSTRNISVPLVGSVKCFAFSGSSVFAGVGYIGGGAFLSTDNGTNWTNVSIGMTWSGTSYVYGYAVSGERIVAATADGIWWRLLSDMISTVSITNPTSNEVVHANEQYTIRWDARGIDSLLIEFSADSGATYEQVARSVPASVGIYHWPVRDVLSAKCVLRLTRNGSAITASQRFKVKGYVLTRFKPNGDYESFDPAIHGWLFPNFRSVMWPQSWWSQFDYENGFDPNTAQHYPYEWHRLPINARSMNFPDWPLFVRAFGIGPCYESLSIPTYSPGAVSFWKANKLKEYIGSCFGFSVSSLLSFDFPDAFKAYFPELGNFTNVSELQANDNNRRVINQLHLYQDGLASELFVHQQARTTVRQTLQDLKTMFLSEIRNDHALALINWGRGGGGHAVVPYALRRIPGSSVFQILVYDSDCPGGNCVGGVDPIVLADSGNNSWTYPPRGFSGGSDGFGLFLNAPANTFLNRPTMHTRPLLQGVQSTTLSYLKILNTIDASITIADSLGNTIGNNDTVMFNTMTDGSPIVVMAGTPQPPIGYFLLRGRYSVRMNSFQDSLATLTVFDSLNAFTYWRSDASSSQADQISYKSGLDVGNRDTQVKRMNLEAIVRLDSSERYFQVLNCATVQNDSLRIATPDSSQLKFVNFGPQKTYDLKITLAGRSTSGLFLHTSIPVPANSSHYIVPNWQDLQHQPVRIYQDIGNVGTIHDTLIVENQTTDVRGQATPNTPCEFKLEQNYPNPFNPTTTIRYALPQTSFVVFTVYNTLAQQVAQLVNEQQQSGYHDVVFRGDGLASGVYFYRIQAGGFVQTRKLVLLQ